MRVRLDIYIHNLILTHMRQFNEDFNGKCCDTNYKQCDWTCEEILQRISSRAALGTVYSRSEIDSRLATLRSLISVAAASNSIIIDTLANRPIASSGNAGYLFVTNDPIPSSGTSYPQQTFVSNGVSWIELINREDFTSESPYTGDMELATFTDGSSDIIRIENGGTGKDLRSSSNGILYLNNGTVTTSTNTMHTNLITVTTDINLSIEDASVQIISAAINQNIFLPNDADNRTYFRIINTSAVNVLPLNYGTFTIYTIAPQSVVDCHYVVAEDTWLVINLSLV